MYARCAGKLCTAEASEWSERGTDKAAAAGPDPLQMLHPHRPRSACGAGRLLAPLGETPRVREAEHSGPCGEGQRRGRTQTREAGFAARRWRPSQPASNLGQRGIFRSGVYRATAMRQDRSATHFIACPHSGNGPGGARADRGSASTLGPGPRCPRPAVNRLPRARRKPSKAGSWHSEEERGAWKRATVCILSTFV